MSAAIEFKNLLTKFRAAKSSLEQRMQVPFGFLNINKPKGITSFDVIYKLRKILCIKKIGHSGTLDPLATGVLPIAVGNAARLIEFLEDDKKYIATLKFGEISATYDEEGEKTFIAQPNFSRSELETVLQSFEGKIKQTPPIYSAIKVGGKKLYELARSGKDIEGIEVQPREIEIYSIKLLECACETANAISSPAVAAKIEVYCSKGTYIRSLAHDIGQKLSCGAYLTDLERIEAGAFKIADSIAIENATLDILIPPINVLSFPQYDLNDEEYRKVRCGNAFVSQKSLGQGENTMLVYNSATVAIATNEGGVIKPLKVFC